MATGRPAAGLVFDDRFLQHNPGPHPRWSTGEPYPFVDPVLPLSNHRLAMRTKHLIDRSGLGDDLLRVPAVSATEDDLRRVHSPEHVARVRELSAAGGGETGDGAPAGQGSYEIARLAAGAGIAAVDAVVASALGVHPATVQRVRRRFGKEGMGPTLDRKRPDRVYERRLDGR